jgi:hypothetical protein
MTTPPGFIKDDELAAAIVKGYNSVPDEKKKPLLSVMLAEMRSPDAGRSSRNRDCRPLNSLMMLRGSW